VAVLRVDSPLYIQPDAGLQPQSPRSRAYELAPGWDGTNRPILS
jgi:hypothetical protein